MLLLLLLLCQTQTKHATNQQNYTNSTNSRQLSRVSNRPHYVNPFPCCSIRWGKKKEKKRSPTTVRASAHAQGQIEALGLSCKQNTDRLSTEAEKDTGSLHGARVIGAVGQLFPIRLFVLPATVSDSRQFLNDSCNDFFFFFSNTRNVFYT